MGEAHSILCGPFSFSRANDGIGRMSSPIALPLMYSCGYDIEKYASIEREIEGSKETYFEMLATSSSGLREGESERVPFAKYMLGVMAICTGESDSRLSTGALPNGNEEFARMFFDRLVWMATGREIMDANSSKSQNTLDRIHAKYPNEGLVERAGATRATAYR